MTPPYGIEKFADDLEAYVKARLNTKITAINTEFGSSPVLKLIDDNAYFFQTLDDRVANYNPFFYYETNDPQIGEPVRGGLIETYQITALICFFSDNADTMTGKKLARYHRVLKEIFSGDNASWKLGRVPMKVVSLTPAGYAQLNATQVARATGITIEVTFGN